MYLPVIAS